MVLSSVIGGGRLPMAHWDTMPVPYTNGTRLLPAGMHLIDIGANLSHKSFDADRGQVIERGLAAGVGRMIVTGSSVTGSLESLRIAKTYPRCPLCDCGYPPTPRGGIPGR